MLTARLLEIGSSFFKNLRMEKATMKVEIKSNGDVKYCLRMFSNY